MTVEMKFHPTQCGQQSFSLRVQFWNSIRRPVHVGGRDSWRQIAVDALQDGQLCKLHARRHQRGVQLDRVQQPAHGILHPVPLHVLPLVVGAQIKVMGLALRPVTLRAAQPTELRPQFQRESLRRELLEVVAPVAVRYAWADSPDCNLFNAEGLPASPFRTDDWPGITK